MPDITQENRFSTPEPPLRPVHPQAVLLSGGLDSLCSAVIFDQAVLIRVATGSRYDGVELAHAYAIAATFKGPEGKGQRIFESIDGVLDLGRYEQKDALVPARNALLALVAGMHADYIILTAVAGDGTHAPDKDEAFAKQMSQLMFKLFGAGAHLALPMKGISKHELLHKALLKNSDAVLKALPHVWSCYNPVQTVSSNATSVDGRAHHGVIHCGMCKACVRLHAALVCNGLLAYGPLFNIDPFTLPMKHVVDVFSGRGSEGDVAIARHIVERA